MNAIIESAPELWHGLLVTLQVTALGSVIAVVVAFTAGIARLSRHFFVRAPAAVFVEVFRGTSLVVQLFWFFFALPLIGVQMTPLSAGVLALGLNEGAYAAEVVRGAIASIPKGQTEACIALDIPPAKRMRRILIPQSIPAMLPPFGNVLVDLLKNTSLVSLVTVLDITYQGTQIRTNTGETTAVFVTLLAVYFVLSLLLSMFIRWLEGRFTSNGKTRSSRKWGGLLPGVSTGGGART
ncbi:ectoine/hydroxyectoine ABC transporter permease subunit EhuC [Streptomyces sp. 3N207]|uniref:ectoine/hydroxyectoine ABC transporter permease subunit EhuC n=1 Tax=Streptomyces sp. 3N207 TaxID=3457417 RepID=UPI003FCF5359